MFLIKDMPVSKVAQLVGEHDTRLWRVVRHYVDAAHQRQDWSKITDVALDDTATKKGHNYATVVVELDRTRTESARLIFMTQDRKSSSVGEFASHFQAHGATTIQIKQIGIDMSKAYISGVQEFFPTAKVVFDRFHVMQLAGKAVDTVRRELKKQGVKFEKGALWALRGNEARLSEAQLALRHALCAQHKHLARAMALRDYLQETWEWPGIHSAEMHLTSWCSWAQRSRLPSFQKLARTIRSHFDGILAYFPDRITSAAMEAINGVIQNARRRARGFKNFDNFRAIAYWSAGKLDLKLPSPYTHPI
jgi:transposase